MEELLNVYKIKRNIIHNTDLNKKSSAHILILKFQKYYIFSKLKWHVKHNELRMIFKMKCYIIISNTVAIKNKTSKRR